MSQFLSSRFPNFGCWRECVCSRPPKPTHPCLEANVIMLTWQEQLSLFKNSGTETLVAQQLLCWSRSSSTLGRGFSGRTSWGRWWPACKGWDGSWGSVLRIWCPPTTGRASPSRWGSPSCRVLPYLLFRLACSGSQGSARPREWPWRTIMSMWCQVITFPEITDSFNSSNSSIEHICQVWIYSSSFSPSIFPSTPFTIMLVPSSGNGRMNLCGVNSSNLEHLAKAVAAVVTNLK